MHLNQQANHVIPAKASIHAQKTNQPGISLASSMDYTILALLLIHKPQINTNGRYSLAGFAG
jgi:hypothetical protein